MNLNNKIINETKAVKQFALSVAMAKKNDEQKRIDAKFNSAIKDIDVELDRISYTSDMTTFVCPGEIIDGLKELIDFCRNAINNRLKKKQKNLKIKKKKKKIKKKI